MLGLGNSITSGYIPFTLTSVSNLELWLQNGVGVTTAKWDDSSGNNNHATQATELNQATVSGGGLDFDGSNDVYELTQNIAIAENGGFCLAAVVEVDVVNNATIAADDSAAEAQLTIVNTTSFKFRATDQTTTTFVFPSGTFPASTKMLILLNRSAGASNRFTFFKNGVALTPDVDNSVNEAQGENPKPIDITYIGALGAPSQFLDGKILELAFWSKGLSATEIADVNSYLQGIHGL